MKKKTKMKVREIEWLTKKMRWFRVYAKSQPHNSECEWNEAYSNVRCKQLKPQDKNEWGERDETDEMNETKIQSQDKNRRICPEDTTGNVGQAWVKRRVLRSERNWAEDRTHADSKISRSSIDQLVDEIL
jgi:hypothetical protein